MRGYLLFVIVVDHLRDTTLFLPFTGATRLWVTAAEGFVLMSGFLVGQLRGEEARTAGFEAASAKLVRRALKIALWTVLVSDLLLLMVTLTGTPMGVMEAARGEGLSLAAKILLGQTLVYVCGYHNILAAYALFLLVSPLMILALLRGHARLLLLISGGLWAVGLVTSLELRVTASFQADLSWQFLWVIGVVAGYHRDAIARRWQALGERSRAWVAAGLALVSALSLGLSWWRWPTDGPGHFLIERLLFLSVRLGPGRLVLSLVWVTTAYLLIRRFEGWFMRWLGWLFIPLGQASLYVFLVHAVIFFPWLGHPTGDLWLGTLRAAGAVLLLWVMVKKRVLFSVIPR